MCLNDNVNLQDLPQGIACTDLPESQKCCETCKYFTNTIVGCVNSAVPFIDFMGMEEETKTWGCSLWEPE